MHSRTEQGQSYCSQVRMRMQRTLYIRNMKKQIKCKVYRPHTEETKLLLMGDCVTAGGETQTMSSS